jgi:hypothetical protein
MARYALMLRNAIALYDECTYRVYNSHVFGMKETGQCIVISTTIYLEF